MCTPELECLCLWKSHSEAALSDSLVEFESPCWHRPHAAWKSWDPVVPLGSPLPSGLCRQVAGFEVLCPLWSVCSGGKISVVFK